LDNIIQIRKEKKFDDFFEFCDRVDGRVVNKKVLESLIKSGAMDSFKLKRAQMAAMLDKILAKSSKKEDPSQFLLFAAPKRQQEIPDIEEWPLLQILGFEKALLGIYVTSHPLYSYENTVKHLKREEIISLYEQESREEVVICGIIEKARMITTRRTGDRMAILKVEDETSNVEVFVFPKLFEEASADIKEKSIVVIKGKLESKERVPKILAAKIVPIERIFDSIKGLNIAVSQEKFPLANLKTIFLNNRGNNAGCFCFQEFKA
jgi:DNA polymerase-3 subunit alpha